MFEVYKGKRVFVTGHTGFKGSWLCEWLLSLGAEVYGYALKPPTNPSLFNQLRLSRRIASHTVGDVRDLKALTKAVKTVKPDFVFHLAAQPLVRESYRTPHETFDTNVMGTVNLLEAVRLYVSSRFAGSNPQTLKPSNTQTLKHSNTQTLKHSNTQTLKHSTPVSVVCITTDKVYENDNNGKTFKEDSPLGGSDPYSASKGACEIAIQSYRRSFFSAPDCPVHVASARAGNVIGGGDWAADRIVPDAMRAFFAGKPLVVRNTTSTRPWQHVLEPLSGYLTLGEKLYEDRSLAQAFNFGPSPKTVKTVGELVAELVAVTGGFEVVDKSDPKAPPEAKLLMLDSRKAARLLGWKPRWGFRRTLWETSEWYKGKQGRDSAQRLCCDQIKSYCETKA